MLVCLHNNLYLYVSSGNKRGGGEHLLPTGMQQISKSMDGEHYYKQHFSNPQWQQCDATSKRKWSRSGRRYKSDYVCLLMLVLVVVALFVVAFLSVAVCRMTSTSGVCIQLGGGESENAGTSEQQVDTGEQKRRHASSHLDTLPSRDAIAKCPGVAWRGSDGSDHGTPGHVGSAGTMQGRYDFPGHFKKDYDDYGRPPARQISEAVCTQPLHTAQHDVYTSLVPVFGQFVDHIVTLTPHSCGDAPNIYVNVSGDPHFDPAGTGRHFEMHPSKFHVTEGNYRHPINEITHWVDGNALYGSSAVRSMYLRQFKNGLLRLQGVPGKGEYPPYNTVGLDNVGGTHNKSMYIAGDLRANEQVPLMSMHVLFLRNHNWHARRIQKLYPEWSDECVYHSARRIVVAELQNIIFNEFVPALLGYTLPPATRYDSNIDPRIFAEFSGAAYRLHTLVNDKIDVLHPHTGDYVKTLVLRDAFMNPKMLYETGVDGIVLGIVRSKAERLDTHLVDSLTRFLFAAHGPPLDLCTLNIVRGRELGLPTYNAMRRVLGLNAARRWNDYDFDTKTRNALRDVYGEDNHEQLDLWVGLMAERRPAIASRRLLGSTLDRIIRDQFLRLRDGDPHYFEYDRQVSEQERRQVRSTTMRDIILRNTHIDESLLGKDLFTQKLWRTQAP